MTMFNQMALICTFYDLVHLIHLYQRTYTVSCFKTSHSYLTDRNLLQLTELLLISLHKSFKAALIGMSV